MHTLMWEGKLKNCVHCSTWRIRVRCGNLDLRVESTLQAWTAQTLSISKKCLFSGLTPGELLKLSSWNVLTNESVCMPYNVSHTVPVCPNVMLIIWLVMNICFYLGAWSLSSWGQSHRCYIPIWLTPNKTLYIKVQVSFFVCVVTPCIFSLCCNLLL